METLATALAPGAAILLSVVTLWLTQRRTQQIDDRAAAKDVVDFLSLQNEALGRSLEDLRQRITQMEAEHLECQHQRDQLLQEVLSLRARG